MSIDHAKFEGHMGEPIGVDIGGEKQLEIILKYPSGQSIKAVLATGLLLRHAHALLAENKALRAEVAKIEKLKSIHFITAKDNGEELPPISPFKAIEGLWPGDESIEELLQTLKDGKSCDKCEQFKAALADAVKKLAENKETIRDLLQGTETLKCDLDSIAAYYGNAVKRLTVVEKDKRELDWQAKVLIGELKDAQEKIESLESKVIVQSELVTALNVSEKLSEERRAELIKIKGMWCAEICGLEDSDECEECNVARLSRKEGK